VLWWRIVRGKTELALVLDEFRVKLFRTVVIAALGCGCDFRPSRRARMIFVVSDKIFGGGEADVSAGLDATVLEKVAGTFPLLFVLFLLFSWGDMGVTRASDGYVTRGW
jgi:hypothetical protein